MKSFQIILISFIVIFVVYLSTPKFLAINLNRFPLIDYSLLTKSLENKDFKIANQQTDIVLSKIIGIKHLDENTFLLKRDIYRLPCTHLKQIDQLWSGNSDGKFGLVAQAKVWESIGGKPGLDDDLTLLDRFQERVGWKNNTDNYDVNSPVGHLPSGILARGVTLSTPHLAKRLKECKIY